VFEFDLNSKIKARIYSSLRCIFGDVASVICYTFSTRIH